MPRNKPHAEETKRKIGLANKGIWIEYFCDYCDKKNEEKQSHFRRKKRHFCDMKCYSLFRKEKMPKEEQNAFKGGGLPIAEKRRRVKARSDANHALRDGILQQMPCEACSRKDAQMHHWDYDKPLQVRWLCVKCHREEHRLIYHQHPQLLKE